VTETQIAHAMSWSFGYLKVVAEPSGAAALAAHRRPWHTGGPVGVIISGGSVSLAELHQLVALVASSRAWPPSALGCGLGV
jgi:threonine dehydratase